MAVYQRLYPDRKPDPPARSVLSVFVGGQGISCFKLSYLQTDWLLITWISFFLAVMAFWWVFEVLTRLYDGWSAADMGSVYKYYSSADSPLQANRILISMAVITLVSILAFAFEAWRLGFVPMFSYGVPHAYSYFILKGSITLLYPAYWSQVFPSYTV